MRHSHAGTAHTPTGEKPDVSTLGSSSRRAGHRVRSPRRWASAKGPSASGCNAPARVDWMPSVTGPHLGPHVGCRPSSSRSCPSCCSAGPKPLASVARCGPVRASRRSCNGNVGSRLVRAMSAACAKPSAGVRNSRPAVPANGTKWPSPAGGGRPGPRSTGGPSPRADDSPPR